MLWKLYYPLDGTIKSLCTDKSSSVSQNSQVCSTQESIAQNPAPITKHNLLLHQGRQELKFQDSSQNVNK